MYVRVRIHVWMCIIIDVHTLCIYSRMQSICTVRPPGRIPAKGQTVYNSRVVLLENHKFAIISIIEISV